MITFLEAYAIHGVERIASALGIPAPEADRLVIREMDRRYQARVRGERRRA